VNTARTSRRSAANPAAEKRRMRTVRLALLPGVALALFVLLFAPILAQFERHGGSARGQGSLGTMNSSLVQHGTMRRESGE
jgi:hypothetical protein